MPTYDKLQQFIDDWRALTPEERRFFLIAVEKFIQDLRAGTGFRKGLRVKAVQGHPGIFELTWAPNGRATFQYGSEVRPGTPHIICGESAPTTSSTGRDIRYPRSRASIPSYLPVAA